MWWRGWCDELRQRDWRGIDSCRQIDNAMSWWREAHTSVSAVKPRYIGCTNFSPTSLVEWLSSAETNARYTLLTVEATRAVRPVRSTTQEVVDDGRPDSVSCSDGRQWYWGCFWSAGCCVTVWKKANGRRCDADSIRTRWTVMQPRNVGGIALSITAAARRVNSTGV